MKIGVPRETHPGERRVATTPEVAGQLQKLGYEVVVEKDAGAAASFSDEAYKEPISGPGRTSYSWCVRPRANGPGG